MRSPVHLSSFQFYEFGAIQTSHATLDIWGTNSTLRPLAARLELVFHDLLDADWSESTSNDVFLLPNQSTEFLQLRCPGPTRAELNVGDPHRVASATVVATARLRDAASGRVIAHFSDWPEPYRFLAPPDPGLHVRVVEDAARGTTTLTLGVARPARCVVLSVEGVPARWSDNALDLVPGEEQEVVVSRLEGRSIRVAYFGRERAVDI